jgi:hypothetical protein
MNYPLIFYTDKIKHAGEVRGPVVFIRPQYREDKGLHAHELVHVRQWLVATALAVVGLYAVGVGLDLGAILCPAAVAAHGVLYNVSDDYRLYCEVEAYAEQAEHYPDDRVDLFGKFVAEDYNLDISAAEAAELIRNYRS